MQHCKNTMLLFFTKNGKFLKFMQQNEKKNTHIVWNVSKDNDFTKKGIVMEERELVKKAKKGDVDAFGCLYEKVYEKMYKYAYYSLRSPEDAEDAVSEAVTAAFSGIRSLMKEESFESWIFRILTNICRKKQREYYTAKEELNEEMVQQEDTSKEEQVTVQEYLFSLDENDRAIIVLHHIFGYTSAEIAKMLSINDNTVRSRESRALKKMAETLGDLR